MNAQRVGRCITARHKSKPYRTVAARPSYAGHVCCHGLHREAHLSRVEPVVSVCKHVENHRVKLIHSVGEYATAMAALGARVPRVDLVTGVCKHAAHLLAPLRHGM